MPAINDLFKLPAAVPVVTPILRTFDSVAVPSTSDPIHILEVSVVE